MNNREKYLHYINGAQQILSSLNLSNDLLETLKHNIKTAELIIPVVGAFSAGKSSLINSFLGQNFLPTAITPETALATELRYSIDEYIEAIDSENNAHRYTMSELATIKDNAKNYQCLKIYLNNDNLKAIQPLVLVDMPGFNAPIETHQQAILNYLHKGVHFIFLTSIEEGNITQSMQRELESLRLFNKGFSFGITKTNLRPEKTVADVHNHIKSQLESYNFNQELILLDDKGGDNLKKILLSINPEALFASLFLDVLKENYLDLIQTINLNISTLSANKEESESAIKLLKEAINKLQEEKESAISQIYETYTKSHASSIANNVAKALLREKDTLVNLAIHNHEGYTQEISHITQNLLLNEVQRKFQLIDEAISKQLSEQLGEVFQGQTSSLVESINIDRIKESSIFLLNKAKEGLDSLSTFTQEKAKDKTNQIYKIVTGAAAILTNIANPAIEIAIFFVPEIIDFFQKSRLERQQKERAEEIFVYQHIPEIKRNIQDQIPAILNQQIQINVEQVNARIEASLQQKQQEIETAEKEREENGSTITQRIEALKAGGQQLKTLAEQYLFTA